MRLLRYSRRGEPAAAARLGVLIGHERVADLCAGYALYLVDESGNAKGRELAALYLPAYLAQFLYVGEPAWLALGDAYNYLGALAQSAPDATGLGGEELFIPLAECRLYVPVRPPKLIAVARNYPEPLRAPELPDGFQKPVSSLVAHGRDIVRPAGVRELDCETALAVVIGTRCKHVREEDAYGVVAGYTIVSDFTARDVERREAESGRPFLARSYDTFCAMGPWMVTREAIPDPMDLAIRMRVNGETRRQGNTRDMIHSIPRLIAHFSRLTLQPGDVIATGSPPVSATVGWRPLEPGDVVESEIEGIGVLRNAVVDEPKED